MRLNKHPKTKLIGCIELKFKLFMYIFIIFLILISCSFSKTYPWYFYSLNYRQTFNDSNLIALIDTGYIENDCWKINNVVTTYNVMEESDDVFDHNGHGTALLSIL